MRVYHAIFKSLSSGTTNIIEVILTFAGVLLLRLLGYSSFVVFISVLIILLANHLSLHLDFFCGRSIHQLLSFLALPLAFPFTFSLALLGDGHPLVVLFAGIVKKFIRFSALRVGRVVIVLINQTIILPALFVHAYRVITNIKQVICLISACHVSLVLIPILFIDLRKLNLLILTLIITAIFIIRFVRNILKLTFLPQFCLYLRTDDAIKTTLQVSKRLQNINQISFSIQHI